MIALARNDHSIVGRWWWTVDRWSLVALILLIGVGAILIMAASPAIAERMGVDSFYFVRRHVMFLLPAVALMFGVSLMSPRSVRRLAVVGLALTMVLMLSPCSPAPRSMGRGAGSAWAVSRCRFPNSPSPFSRSPPPGCSPAGRPTRRFPPII